MRKNGSRQTRIFRNTNQHPLLPDARLPMLPKSPHAEQQHRHYNLWTVIHLFQFSAAGNRIERPNSRELTHLHFRPRVESQVEGLIHQTSSPARKAEQTCLHLTPLISLRIRKASKIALNQTGNNPGMTAVSPAAISGT